MSKVDIFVKSYKPDFWLLQLSLQTIKKNVTGYNNIILLIPEVDKHDFDTRDMPERTLIFYIQDRQPGWLMQQYFKMTAYHYSDADFIMFSDSDNFFDHPINVQDLVKDGKPEILYTDYKKLPDAIIWKEPTDKFIGEPQEFEFMRRLPLIYHRKTLVNIARFAPNLQHIIMTSHKFSEFNAMGAYAFKYEKEDYNFVNTEGWQYVEPHSIQVWSHGNKLPGADDLHLREYIRILETLLKSFGIKLA